jgi:4-hydroxy-tetrahydrodipicolinate reductase
MGREVAVLVREHKDMELVAGVEAESGTETGRLVAGCEVTASLAEVVARGDVVVDFSTAEATAANCRVAADAGKPFITGVTGLSALHMKELHDSALKVPVVYAPNFSVGVSVLVRLVAEAAKLLGKDYDVEVIESHHRMKKDSPSGTAARLVDVLRAETGRKRVRHGREGMAGPKPDDEIGVSSIRTGSVVGEHTVVFGGPGERVELTHKAESRAAFASGVIAAIRFVTGSKPGFYHIEDVLAGR